MQKTKRTKVNFTKGGRLFSTEKQLAKAIGEARAPAIELPISIPGGDAAAAQLDALGRKLDAVNAKAERLEKTIGRVRRLLK